MTRPERQQLIDALLECDISEADFLRLEADLSVDPEARHDYYERVRLSLLLEDVASGKEGADDRVKTLSLDVRASRRRWRWAFAGMVMVASALLMVVSWQWKVATEGEGATSGDRSSNSLILESAERLAAGFAVVSGQADAVWADGRTLVDGGLVPVGEMHLISGVVAFELFSGVILVVEGEARFSILSPMEAAVFQGKVRARVPEPAQGFRIMTEAGEIVDLGTEFAVSVTDEGSELHVLEGEVEWHSRGSKPRRMERGEAARLAKNGVSNGFSASTEAFVGPLELRDRLQTRHQTRLLRWRERSREWSQDPRLLAYYRVTAEELSVRRLRNLALARGETGSEGAVVAAAAAPNRWGESESALDFSPAGSRVRLSIPGEHRSLTLLCWVKISSLDRWYNSLFLTDGHDEGEPHWQIMNDGRLFFSVKKRDRFDLSQGEKDKHVYFSEPFWNSELSGQWLMIATVYDVDARRVTHYLNGKVLSTEAIPEEYVVESVRIGNASLGNWGLPEREEPRFAVRNLNGSLDEFAIFGAALSADEIRSIHDDGKP